MGYSFRVSGFHGPGVVLGKLHESASDSELLRKPAVIPGVYRDHGNVVLPDFRPVAVVCRIDEGNLNRMRAMSDLKMIVMQQRLKERHARVCTLGEE